MDFITLASAPVKYVIGIINNTATGTNSIDVLYRIPVSDPAETPWYMQADFTDAVHYSPTEWATLTADQLVADIVTQASGHNQGAKPLPPPPPPEPTTRTWVGEGSPGDGGWMEASNWSPEGVPNPGDTLVLPG